MAIETKTNYGNISITSDAIASLAGGIITECYGVVGMASKQVLKDGWAELLKRENYSKGVVIKNTDGMIDVDLYIIVSFGVKITETVKEAQKKVKYMLEKTLSQDIHSVNVFVQGVRCIVFKGMLESGCNNLNGNKKEVDALNVFPVPDGDTGTNMSLTFTNGVSEVKKSGSDSLPTIAKTLSRGLLMGARGNSGVILSQIFRGIYQYIGEKTELSSKEFSEALLNGSKLAYKAVMRPTEGTILTVIREASAKGEEFINANPEASIEEFMNAVLDEANASLERTPELLPVLKEAHVVDSGGAGLVKVLEGFKAFLDGNPITEETVNEEKKETKSEHSSGYRCEFILAFDAKHAKSFNEDRFRKSLEALGNKVQLVVKEDGISLSLHTMTPGEVLMLAERYGEFKKVQIENIQDDLKPSLLEEEKEEEVGEAKEYGIIAVAAGEGIKQLFTEYRTDYVVSGGQTMNPSTEDIASAIAKVNAKHVFVLPNNSNIIMAANQAATVTEDKDVIVLPTKSVPQGLSACINFNR